MRARSRKKKKSKLKLPKREKITAVRDRIWRKLSLYTRLRYSNNGMVRCVTCGEVKPLKEMQGGHFLHGKNKATYLEPDVIHPQCVRCNFHLSGNMTEYTLFMVKKYGEERVRELIDMHKRDFIYKRPWLEEREDMITCLLERTKKIKRWA